GETEHCRVKGFWGRTNKNRFAPQIGKHERRRAKLRAIKRKVAEGAGTIPQDVLETDRLPFTDPQNHHHISESKAVPLNIFSWIQAMNGDPAGKVGIFGY
ncbi:hypothetical protein H0H93_000798, partial [Arthromyces matolae]